MHFHPTKLLFAVLLLLLKETLEYYSDRTGTTCFSINNESGMFFGHGTTHQENLEALRRWSDCETIIGNMVIMNIHDPNGTQLEFLKSVRKITGYLAINKSNLTVLPFPNLQIISGQNLVTSFQKPMFALFVSHINGISYPGLNNLQEISNGDVRFEMNNKNLTVYSDTILWPDIVLNGNTSIIPLVNDTAFNWEDYLCHPSCKYPGSCWGPREESCQDLSMEICEGKCPGRCFFQGGYSEPICCHKECAGGCSGTSNLDCFGCRNFNATGLCVTQCPPPKIYDKKLFQNVENMDVLYGLGNECLEECPSPYFTEEGNCVKQCSENLMVEEHTSQCVPCPIEGCPKRCRGFSNTPSLKEVIGQCSDVKKGRKCSKLFKQKYQNCTIIDGNIDIDARFKDKFGTAAAAALEALNTVEEITGYLSIVTNNLFTDFSFLRNLKRIKGIDMKTSHSCESGTGSDTCIMVNLQATITIQALGDYTLKQLRLNSLELIERGIIIIHGDKSSLCYLPEKEALARIMRKPDLNMTTDILIKFNREYCATHDYACHDVCTGGCWGPGPGNCVQCSNFSYEGQCVTSCDAMEGVALYEDTENNTCKRCHPECEPTSDCTGPDPDQCRLCRNFKDGPYCVPECPKIKYANQSGVCMECDGECIEERGCTGPNSFIGEAGCNFCPVVRLMEEAYTENGQRLGQCAAKCADDQYADNLKPYENLPTHDKSSEERVKVCTPCHEYCSTCKTSGTSIYACECKYAQDGESCFRECPAGKYRSLLDKTCKVCDGPCPRNCIGSDLVPLNRTSILEFANCDLVEGSVIINYQSWFGPDNVTATHMEALNEIITITGRLVIRDSPDPDFTNLDMLRRVQSVGEDFSSDRKRRATDNYVLEIDNNTALETAELVSLTDIGGPMILSGENLCYVDTIDWEEQFGGNRVDVSVTNSACADKLCHAECSDKGCLGPGNDMCVSCENKEFEGWCLSQCAGQTASYDDGTKLCKPCHENCIACTNGGNQHCIVCKYVNDGSACVRECTKPYTYIENKECRDCDPACKEGCSGPGSYLGIGGCNFCKIHDNTVEKTNTVQLCAHTCPPKSFKNINNEAAANKYREECIPCHPQCSKCAHQWATNCIACVNVKQGAACQESCNKQYYPGPNRECVMCHEDCETCIGPGSANCTSCKGFEVRPPEIMETKICVKECPDKYAYKITGNDGDVCAENCDEEDGVQRDNDYCGFIQGRSEPGRDGAGENTVAVAVAVGVAIVIIFIVVGLICWKRVKQNQKKRMNLLKHAQRCHDNINPIYEPVMQDDAVYPLNDGQLLIVTEDSLEIGDVLGSGAFGKVYEGRWHPTESVSDNDRGLRVAIKILKESGDPESTREFFDEAVVMGKLDHKHLVRILCLCAGKMMLVTQLMPLGSLLDYVRKHKTSLSAHHLLTYGYQIAKGMSYLEENNVVHRDLAARNVLVQTPTFVKITDFGLAKMLSNKKLSFTSEGGKLPIKWLAIESLKYRQFTPRSDTWSYGVTIWEVLEFGQLPWRTKPPNELIRSLEMGERLTKPKTCTLEVYAVMLRCWVLEPAARPNFEDLMCSMEEFLKEPNRFVHTLHNNRASTEGSFLSPHASITSEYRDSGIVDVDRNYENDDRAMAIQRALYDATSSLKPHENLHYDPALTADQDDVFSESPSTARNSVIEMNRHDYVQDYLVPDQYSVDEGNGTDSSQDQGYVKMNGSDYADLESASPEYSNTDDLAEEGLTQSLLEHKHGNKNSKNKFLPNRTPSPRPTKHLNSPKPSRPQSSPRPARIRDDGYSSLKEPLSDVQQPLTGPSSADL